jgi:hypothetical protein
MTPFLYLRSVTVYPELVRALRAYGSAKSWECHVVDSVVDAVEMPH